MAIRRKQLPDKEQHGIFEIPGKSGLNYSALRDRIDQYIKAGNLTKDEYFKLLTGQYGHLSDPEGKGDGVICQVLDTLYELPENHESKSILADKKLHDKVIDFLASHYIAEEKPAEQGVRVAKKHAFDMEHKLLNTDKALFSKEKALDMIHYPENYLRSSERDGKIPKGELAGQMIHLFPKDKDVLHHAILAHPEEVALQNYYRGDDVIDPEHLEPHIINHYLDSQSVMNIRDKRTNYDRHIMSAISKSPHLDENTAQRLITENMKSGSYSTIPDLLKKLPESTKNKFLDRVLGIEGGSVKYTPPPKPQKPDLEGLSEEDRVAALKDYRKELVDHYNELKEWDDETNWQNYDYGKLYNEGAAHHLLRHSSLLDDKHIDHIIRHGTPEEKWELFHNEHIHPKHHQRMYDLWDDEDKDGWKQEEIADMLKEHNDDIDDDIWSEVDQEEADNYPIHEFISDRYDLEDNPKHQEEVVGQSKEDFIDEHLSQHSWVTPNPKYAEGQPALDPSMEVPQFINHSNDIESHPEYESRLKDAESAWEKKVEEAVNSPDDHIRERYWDAISESDSRWENAREKHINRIENWFDGKDYTPSFLDERVPAFAEKMLKRQQKESANARIDASYESNQEENHLNAQVAKRVKEHTYANGLHHHEMVKDYADANGGKVDIGTLNKLHPNQKETWKKIFGDKGKLTSEEIAQKIEALPKIKYNISHGVWDRGIQNINNRPQTIFRLDHSEDSEKELMADKDTWKTFRRVQEASKRSGHPTNFNTIAWARVDTTDPKRWMVDELQSDFSSSVRRALEEHGATEKASHIKKIESAHKNWREALLHHVIKTAKENGVEVVFTHSPESKAAHTGADTVHTVYKDSYQKVPRSMGFKEAHPDHMPLTDRGARHFRTAISDESVADRLKQHSEAFLYHSRLAGSHQHFMDKKYVNYKIEGGDIRDLEYDYTDKNREHEDLLQHHADLARAHQEIIQQLDPLDEHAKMPAIKNIDEWMKKAPDKAIASLWDAKIHAHQQSEGQGSEMPYHPFDKKVEEAEATPAPTAPQHMGHMFDLRPQAVKKNIIVADLLLKAEMKDDDKVAVAQALMNIKSQQQLIEQLKQHNPEAYQAIADLTQTLVYLFKELNDEPIEAVENQLEAESQMQEMQPPVEGSSPQFHVPAHQQKITHGSKELPIGAIRQYDAKTIREKAPDGRWIGAASGEKREDWQ